MQCCGLDDERRRCAAPAVAAQDYCAQHQHLAALQPLASARVAEQRLTGLIRKLRAQPAQRVVPDGARFAVPSFLARSSTAGVIDHLHHHPSSMIRWAAAFVLRKRRASGAIDPLWHTLRIEPVGFVRQQAAVALGKIGAPTTLSPLIETLWHDRDASVRQACAVALGNLGYSLAARDLARVLDRECAAFVRWDCILALGQVGDATHTPLLAALAEREPSSIVRNACHDALAEIRRRMEE